MLPLIVPLILPLTTTQPYIPSIGASCMDRSLAGTSLAITNASIDRGSRFQQKTKTVSFHMAHPTLGIETTCNATSIALTPNGIGSDPYVLYPCVVQFESKQKGGERLDEVRVRFAYDATLNYLTLEGTWVCVKPGDRWQERTPVYIEGWNEFEVGANMKCVEGGGFSRKCIQAEGSEFKFEVVVSPALRRGQRGGE